jgi:heterotetrameric sarcosine oxidase gamma subunit
MPELARRSAIGDTTIFESEGFILSEAPDFAIHELWFGKDPEEVEKIFSTQSKILLEKPGAQLVKVAPGKYWYISARDVDGPKISGLSDKMPAAVTSLHSSRCRFLLEGARVRELLAKCAPIDFHPQAFKPEKSVMTGIHHVPALIHCVAVDVFHVYCLRTFAQHVWECLVDAARS